jgi:chlorophyllase
MGGGGAVPDPNLDGPFAIAELDDSLHVAATNHDEPIHCAYPTSGGPFPVILVAHGFQLPASQYTSYVKRLATFGYVALTVDYQAGLFSVSNVDNAKDLIAAIDWAGSKAELTGKADTKTVGTTGHSMGGKLAILAATMDPRIKASITLDPVDASMNCAPADCPDVSKLLPINIPLGFIGETTDAMGGFMPCAPAADNYTTFYAPAASPAIQITAVGANHMSFLDNVAGCGFVCSFCNMPSAKNADVNSMSKAFVVAFYERYLRGNLGYDTYLTGADAQARYVQSGQAMIVSK